MEVAMMTRIEAEGMRRIWLSTIINALRDYAGMGTEKMSRRAHARMAAEIEAWVASEDFAIVCSLAGLDTEATRMRFRAVMDSDIIRQRMKGVSINKIRRPRVGKYLEGVAA